MVDVGSNFKNTPASIVYLSLKPVTVPVTRGLQQSTRRITPLATRGLSLNLVDFLTVSVRHTLA